MVEYIIDGVEVVLHPTQQETIYWLLKAAGLYVINNEKAQEYGLQLGAEEDGSIIGSAECVLGLGGSNSFFQPRFDLWYWVPVLLCCWNIGHV